MDENDDGATVAMVTTENASEVAVSGEHSDYFEVADGNLKLKDGMSLDFEMVEGGMIELTLTASGDGASAEAMVTVTVNDVNEAPTIDVRDGVEVPGHDGVVSNLTIDENAMRGDAPPLALIEVMDPDAADADMLTGDAGVAATSVSDDRFAVILDPENGLWLHLAEGASLDHEADSEVMVTVTYTDSAGNMASADVTVMVADVNEAPVAVGMPDNITTESGVALKDERIDLMALFNDPDAGDASAVRYELSGGPSWLSFSVEFGEDEDGNDTTHGVFSGTPPTTGANSDAAHMVTLTATDSDGAEGSVSFYVIVDDGNDAITDVDFIANDGNVAVEAEVDENDDSGVVFGEIRVHDQDHAMHPSGMHLIQILRGSAHNSSPNAPVDSRFEVKYDDAGIPWLALKAGMSLDNEDPNSPGFVEVTIRAVDLDGATHPPARGGGFIGNVEFQTVTILVNDQNDAPKANTIGNWWVTAAAGQRADDINAGDWLTFSLDTDGADAAFTDPDGDRLTYSLSGPSILEIDSRTGEITNTKGGVPVEGVHRLTVTATDPDGQSATASFYLSIALSGDGTDANANNNNAAPRFPTTPSETPYAENSGDRRVATFTVADDDNNLRHHPFALDSVVITSITSNVANDPMNVTLVDHDSDPTTPMRLQTATGEAGYGAAFVLSDPTPSGNSWNYSLYVRDTDPGRADTTAILDAEYRDADDTTDLFNITVTVSASDGVAAAVEEEVRVRITEVNEAPVAADIVDDGGATDNVPSDNYGVSQSETLKEILYINLEDLWSDPDDNDSPDDQAWTFTASVSGSWIKILHGPARWDDINDVEWGDTDVGNTGTANRTAVIVGDDTTAPAGSERVVIIEIDRTGMNNGQGDKGSFTLTARDRDGATGSKTYEITPTDQNLNPTNAVTLTGSAREDATLRANFNDDRDPDLGGSATPALVIYQWFRADDDAGTGETLVRQGTSDTYKLTQADVGSYITVKVQHYEVGAGDNAGQLVGLDVATIDNEATTTRAVSNTPDKGTGSITITADGNALTVTADGVLVTDGDFSTAGNVVADTDLTYSWEMSDNGRGGWTAVDQEGDSDTATLELDDGEGKWYRAVATYDGDGAGAGTEMESVYSDPIQVSDVRDTAGTAPTISGNVFPGGTLSVNVPNTSVQWQVSRGGNWVDIPGATGSLTLTQAHAGATIRALVSYQSTDNTNPGTTAIVAVPTVPATVPGATTATATPVAVGKHDIELSVDAPGHGATNNAGHNLSHTETVNLASLFQDPDSARLTFTAAAAADSGLGTDANSANSATDGTYVFNAAEGGVLVFEASTGKLTFNSDVYRTHDGTDADGGGNVITLNITASDGTNTSATAAPINVRINVAPTDIWFADYDESAESFGTPDEATTTVTVPEHTGSSVAGQLGQPIATLDVRDQNAGSHKFGTHEVTLSGDDRFMITNTGNGRMDGDSDGSTWEVRLKPGAKLDYETQVDMAPTVAGKQIVLTLTATDSEGLSTPSGPGTTPIRLTITVDNVTSDDRPAPDPNNVPGLQDDETTADDNERVDDTTDDDTDGGSHPPPPGMSLGGIIEDFVDNMDTFEQDLLEDFMLVIDDGIDIA